MLLYILHSVFYQCQSESYESALIIHAEGGGSGHRGGTEQDALGELEARGAADLHQGGAGDQGRCRRRRDQGASGRRLHASAGARGRRGPEPQDPEQLHQSAGRRAAGCRDDGLQVGEAEGEVTTPFA